MKKYLPSSHDILYGQYNPSQDNQAEEQERIHKKYGIFPHQNEYNTLSLYQKEAEALFNNTLEKKKQIIDDAVSKKGGRAKKDWTGEDDEVRYKITSDDSKQNIVRPFLAKLEEYKNKLLTFTDKIAYSTTMKEADSFALEATMLHDNLHDGFHDLEHQSVQCLGEFENALK